MKEILDLFNLLAFGVCLSTSIYFYVFKQDRDASGYWLLWAILTKIGAGA